MATAKCFKCGQGFQGTNEDDVAGDGECQRCKERSKQIAYTVDMQMAKKRLTQTLPTSRIAAALENTAPGEMIRFNARDLGLF